MRSLTITAAFLLGATAHALAHAQLRRAAPPVGSTVHAAPGDVEIVFSEGVEPRFSAIVVQDETGKRVDKGDVHTLPGDDKRLAVGLGPLPPGTYKVIWHATAVDTHKTEGSFTFTVAP